MTSTKVRGAAHPDSAFIYVGGLAFELTEGDVITIFSQYGEVMHIHLPKPRIEPGEKDKGKARQHNRGFGFLMYEDQRSTVLAVDNLNGAKVLGRTLRVDHVANYQHERTRNEDGEMVEPDAPLMNCAPPDVVVDDDDADERDADLEDPMAAYFAERRREKRAREHSDSDRTERERRHRTERERPHRSERSHSHRERSERDSSERSRSHRHRREGDRSELEHRSHRDRSDRDDERSRPTHPHRDDSERRYRFDRADRDDRDRHRT